MKSLRLAVCMLAIILSGLPHAPTLFSQDSATGETEIDALKKRLADLETRNAELERIVRDLVEKQPKNIEGNTAKIFDPNAFAPKSMKLKIDGEIRARVEFNDNYDFDSGQKGPAAVNAVFQDNNDFVGMRMRLGLDFDVYENLRAYVQVQDSRLWGEEASTAADDQNADFHQIYFDLRNLGEWWPTIRIGRQELSYGDQKLVGPFGWNNIGRAFDGVRLFWQREKWDLDIFTTNVDEADDLDTGDGGNADDDTLFSGIYGTYRFIKDDQKSLKADGYIFHLRNGTGTIVGEDDLNANGVSDRTGDLDFMTIGTRWEGRYKGLDAALEFAYQTGQRAHNDLRAYAWFARAGYTFDMPWKPRLGVEYNFGTGDDNPTDGDYNTFSNLFPTNHLHYGYADLVSWQNIKNWRLSLSANPAKDWKVQADWHWFRLDETEDSFYMVSGAARGAGAGLNGGRAKLTPALFNAGARRSDEVGQELDLTVQYKFSDHIHFMAGYSHFFTDDFLDDTSNPDLVTGLQSGADDADWMFFQITVQF